MPMNPAKAIRRSAFTIAALVLCFQPTAMALMEVCLPLSEMPRIERARLNTQNGRLKYIPIGKARSEKECQQMVKERGGGFMHWADDGTCYIVEVITPQRRKK